MDVCIEVKDLTKAFRGRTEIKSGLLSDDR